MQIMKERSAHSKKFLASVFHPTTPPQQRNVKKHRADARGATEPAADDRTRAHRVLYERMNSVQAMAPGPMSLLQPGGGLVSKKGHWKPPPKDHPARALRQQFVQTHNGAAGKLEHAARDDGNKLWVAPSQFEQPTEEQQGAQHANSRCGLRWHIPFTQADTNCTALHSIELAATACRVLAQHGRPGGASFGGGSGGGVYHAAFTRRVGP